MHCSVLLIVIVHSEHIWWLNILFGAFFAKYEQPFYFCSFCNSFQEWPYNKEMLYLFRLTLTLNTFLYIHPWKSDISCHLSLTAPCSSLSICRGTIPSLSSCES